MREEIEAFEAEAEAGIAAAQDAAAVEAARVEYLGRKGRLRQFYARLKEASEAERPEIGGLLNRVQARLEELLAERQDALEHGAVAGRIAAESVDVTMPGRAPRIGKRHPLLTTLEDMVDVFIGMGFNVAEGPEVETYYYSFPALNYPEWHPAMDSQMTFYVSDGVLLRSQTSTVQIRVMENQQPPVRVVVPGRCFRRDTVDATHSHTFYQLEGLLVDEGVTFADLKGALEVFARGMFGPDIHTRFRPDFFPFTEPSAEFSLTCVKCRGAGQSAGDVCRMCKGSGWLEVGGSGMVDPNVLAGVGYDPERYTGWAFGCGIERFAMLRYGIDDIRLFYQSDMRFLEQF
jgi:phenylalanyl-tRNA synthetase alpha chain